MNHRAGFTIIELAITITIMAILTVVAVVSLHTTQANGRDEERKTDVATIALYLESIYTNGTTAHPEYKGTYPVVGAASNAASIESWFTEFDSNNLRAPNVDRPAYSLTAATNNTTTLTGVRPVPTIATYVYQPLDGNGALCTAQSDCRHFTIYYMLETNPTIQSVTSKN